MKYLIGFLLGVVCCAVLGQVQHYPEAPPAAHTGGFGEPTCQRCHFDQPLNAPGGSLTLEGFPEVYLPGTAYTLRIRLVQAGLQRGGFQLSARFADGMEAARQAGVLQPIDERSTVVHDDSTMVQYAQHTEAGTEAVGVDTMQWGVAWTAPDVVGAVVFHLSANAANGDASEFGDFIYATSWSSSATSHRD